MLDFEEENRWDFVEISKFLKLLKQKFPNYANDENDLTTTINNRKELPEDTNSIKLLTGEYEENSRVNA